MRPAKKVPTVRITAGAVKVMPETVTTPCTRPPVTTRSATSCWNSGEVRLVLEQPADRLAVEHPVRLRAGGTHRRSLARVQGPELDAGPVGGTRHRPAQGVDLAHQVSLADAPDRGIAAHLPQGLDALGDQQRARTHARGSQGGLGAGMAAADDDDLVAGGLGFRIHGQCT